MPENPRASDTPTLADLLSDPIVQLVLKADHLTDEQLRTLIGPALHGPRAETGLPLESNQKRGLSAKNYRPGLGIMLLQYAFRCQKWFVMRFMGSDAELNIKTCGPEFSAWRVPAKELPKLIVPFKRSVSQSLLDELRDICGASHSRQSGTPAAQAIAKVEPA